MNCPNCKSKNIKIDSLSADQKEVYIYCKECKLYSTLYQKGATYTEPNDIDEAYINQEKEEWKKDPTYQNC
jgi:transcription elongation factor Elf1